MQPLSDYFEIAAKLSLND